jgi:hypothetical protein
VDNPLPQIRLAHYVVVVAFTAVLAACGSSSVSTTNQAPVISSLAPISATAGEGALTLTVNGSGFASTSSVTWNGSALATSYVSATQLTAAVPAGNLTTAGSANVAVSTPAPGGGSSGAAVFDINQTNPAPAIAALAPNRATQGNGDFTLAVTGASFVASSVVTWNGSALTTQVVDSAHLTATVQAQLVASPGSATVTVVNPAPGGGSSQPAVFAITSDNPLPAVTSVAPSSAAVGSGALTLTVSGTDFVLSSVVLWNGVALPTTFVSDSTLTASVPASDLASVASVQVTVSSPSPGGGTSGAAVFDVTSSNPLPSLSSLAPYTAAAKSLGFTLTVKGSNFVGSSTIAWNGVPLDTTYISATGLTASVPAADIANAGTAKVTVISPAPGGGTSAAQTFTITSDNPAPALAAIQPSSAAAGASALTLTVTGTGFISGSIVNWNGTALPTTYASSTKLTAQVSKTLLASAGAASVTVTTGTPGGGTSTPVNFTITPDNPAPTLASVLPTSVTAGTSAFTLTANGSHFIASSVLHWNGSALPTTYVSSTELTAQVAASFVAAAGSASVTVVTPTPGGGTSAAATLTINSTNPAPTLSSLAPSGAAAGGSAFTLTVTGSGFVAKSVVDWNGIGLPTNFVSDTKLTAAVPASDIANGGSAQVKVSSPTPGGGTSSVASFSITTGGTSAPQLVQYNIYQTVDAAGENQSTVQFNSATHAGNIIWVAVTVSDYDGAHTISVSDTQGNNYTLLDQENDGRPGSATVAHFYARNIVGDSSTPDTVTVNWGYDNYKGVLAVEISGASGLIGHSGNIQDALGQGTNNVTTGSVAVSSGQTPALLVALSYNTSGGASDTGGSGFGGPTAGNSMTQVTQLWDYGVNLGTFATREITSPGNVAATFNAPDTDSYVTIQAIFR